MHRVSLIRKLKKFHAIRLHLTLYSLRIVQEQVKVLKTEAFRLNPKTYPITLIIIFTHQYSFGLFLRSQNN